MIQEKWKDSQKLPMDQGVVEDHLRAFNKWLQEEYVQPTGKVGVAPKSALTICAAIVDFYRRHNLPLNIKFTQEFEGAAKGVNETEKMTAEQIEKIAYHAPTKRDKAIVWVMFQGGMDVSTVCSLNWGHVEKELANPPMGAVMLRGLTRKKEPSKTFISFMYKTAVKHVRAYLEDRFDTSNYAEKMEYDTPLFVGEGKWKSFRYKPRHIQAMLRSIAPDVGIAASRQKKADINPLRPHALRASFSDQMAKTGASRELIDFIQGHKLRFDAAYFGGEAGLREAYIKYAELALEPRRIKPAVELEGSLRDEIDRRKQLEQRVELQLSLLKLREKELGELREEFEEFKEGVDKKIVLESLKTASALLPIQENIEAQLKQMEEALGHSLSVDEQIKVYRPIVQKCWREILKALATTS